MNWLDLREPMPMPDPSFPIKLHPCHTHRIVKGATLFPHHWHEHLEFLYFVSGTAMVECGSAPYAYRAGDLCIVNSNELHYGVGTSEDLSYYTMIVDIALLHSHSVDAIETKFITPILNNRLLFQNRVSGDADVTRCMVSIIGELERKELGYELSVKSHLYGLLSILVRKYVAASAALDEYGHKLKDMERLAPVFAYIDAHYRDRLAVEELASLVGLSRYHFSRLFKQITDKSLVEYINLVRINKAESLLRATSMTISQVALETGFNDIYYFSRTFKRLKRMPPTQWRQANDAEAGRP
ncbi:AraC family transcriptional regulator [Paenibacillus sp. MMS18-CY102]|uniref:AraC family transcriptional regulator n=1 Tax=Paenibacillus sp. MMS18-CY102 TaxID=2682849 RepID=UPI001F1FB7F6|nr:AraC family transcriptional regulator [Paenibacillus sp. MMS18-CY102]